MRKPQKIAAMRIIAPLFLGCWFAPNAGAQTSIEYSDHSFVNWSTTHQFSTALDYPPQGVAEGAHYPSGGNPGEYWYVNMYLPANVKNTGGDHTNGNIVYDPSIMGPIISLQVDFDYHVLGQSHPGESSARFTANVTQNGVIYHGPGLDLAYADGWHHYSAALSADSFNRLTLTGPTRPDFTSQGAPLRFGVTTELNGGGQWDAYFNPVGIDNWNLAVHRALAPVVPSQSRWLMVSIAFLSAACGALALRRSAARSGLPAPAVARAPESPRVL